MRTQKETDLQDKAAAIELIERARKLDSGTGSLVDLMADEIERLQSAMQYTGAELGKARERIAELEADLDAAEEYICELKVEQWGET